MQAQIRCLIFTCSVVAALPRRKDGSTLVTGVSQVSFPWSTSLASISVVIALVLDATMKSVPASTFSLPPSSRAPKPPAKTTFPSCSRPTATPGTLVPCMARSTNAPSSATRASSRRWALRPANDSRV